MYEASKVPGLVGISPIWGPSEPHTRGHTTSELADNWCPVRIWNSPKVNCGVCPSFPKKVSLGALAGVICSMAIPDHFLTELSLFLLKFA